MAKTPVKFGTDGWRGIIAKDFTIDNVRLAAQGVAGYLREAGLAEKGVVVGYDTRFGSEDFAAAAAEVLAGAGIKVYLTPRPTPTPVISFAAPFKKTAGAVVITASHNPYRWNGFKFKAGSGAPAPTEVERQIESHIDPENPPKSLPLQEARDQGLLEDYDPIPDYITHISRLVDIEAIKSADLKVIVDPMYGAGAGILASLLGGGKMEIVEIHGQRNPLFPGMHQPEPIARNLGELISAVKETGALVGLATDGDADRVGVVDEKGRFLTQLQVFPLLALYFLEYRKQIGNIARTLTSTVMLNRLAEIYHVSIFETPVGFKYIAPYLMEHDCVIGGEESGGYGFRGHVPERDGILASLFFLDFMLKAGRTPSQLLEDLYSRVGPHYYDRIDLSFAPEDRERIMGLLKQIEPEKLGGVRVRGKDTLDGFRFHLEDGSWLLIRFSGTEPLLRLYAESATLEKARELLEEGRRLVGL